MFDWPFISSTKCINTILSLVLRYLICTRIGVHELIRPHFRQCFHTQSSNSIRLRLREQSHVTARHRHSTSSTIVEKKKENYAPFKFFIYLSFTTNIFTSQRNLKNHFFLLTRVSRKYGLPKHQWLHF